MGYATQADLIVRFGEPELVQLSDRVGAGVPDAAIVARALEDAAAEIEGYLAARYALPLLNVPGSLVRIACDIARFRLFGDQASAEVRTRYEDARRVLESIARGTVSLGLPALTTAPALAEMRPGNVRVASRLGSEGY